jgi:hypothetical protein
VPDLDRDGQAEFHALRIDGPIHLLVRRGSDGAVAIRVRLEANAAQPELLRETLDLPDDVHRLAARIHGPHAGEAVGVLRADLGHLFVADDVVVAVAEGGQHQPVDAGGVHVVDDLLAGHAALE